MVAWVGRYVSGGLVAATGAALAFTACDTAGRNGGTARSASELPGAPIVSTDFGLATSLLAPANVQFIAVAPGPGSYLLIHPREQVDRTRELYATRVLANGAIPEPRDVLLDTTRMSEAYDLNAVLAEYTGEHWIVVHNLRSIVVGDDGMPISRTDLPFRNEYGSEGDRVTDLRWGGDRALVTAIDDQGTFRGLFLDANGAPIGSPFVIVLDAVSTGGAIAFDGSSFLTAFTLSTSTTLVVSSITASGPTGMSATLYETDVPYANVSLGGLASNGAGFLAGYQASPSCDSSGNCVPYGYFRRTITVDGAGVISLGAELDASSARLEVSNGTYFSWLGLDGQRLDASGNPLTAFEPVLAPASNVFESAIGPSGFELVPERAGDGFLAFSASWVIRLDANLLPLDDPPLAPVLSPAPQNEPAVTFASNNYVATWYDQGRGGLVATRIASDGSVLDPDPVEIATGLARGPVIGSNGSDVLVTWNEGDYYDAFAGAVRWTPGGEKVPFVVPGESLVRNVDFGSDGTNYLVAWGLLDSFDSARPRLHAALLPPEGPLTSALDFGESDVRHDVVFDGEHYVVMWGMPGTAGNQALLAVRITRDLTLVDSRPKVILRYPGADVDFGPRLAVGDGGLLVVWVESTNNVSATPNVRCARVTPDLELVDGSNVIVGEQTLMNEAFRVAWDGSSYWVLWQNNIWNGLSTLLGRRLAANGTFLDERPFAISADLQPTFRGFGLTAGPPGELMVVYERGGTSRTVRGRLLSSLPGSDGGAGGTGGEAGAGGSGIGGSATGGAPVGGSSAGESSQAGEAGAHAGNGGEDSGGAPTTGGRGDAAAGAGGNNGESDAGCDCSLYRPTSERNAWAAVLAMLFALAKRRMRQHWGPS